MGRVRQFVEFLRERAIVQHETPRGLLAPNRRVDFPRKSGGLF